MIGVTQKAYAAWESGGKPQDIVAVARRVEQLWPAQVTAAWLMGVDERPGPPDPPTPTRRAPRERGRRVLRFPGHPTELGDTVSEDAMAYVLLAEEGTIDPHSRPRRVVGSGDPTGESSGSSSLPRVDSNHQPFDQGIAA